MQTQKYVIERVGYVIERVGSGMESVGNAQMLMASKCYDTL